MSTMNIRAWTIAGSATGALAVVTFTVLAAIVFSGDHEPSPRWTMLAVATVLLGCASISMLTAALIVDAVRRALRPFADVADRTARIITLPPVAQPTHAHPAVYASAAVGHSQPRRSMQGHPGETWRSRPDLADATVRLQPNAPPSCGLDAEVIALGRSISRKIAGNAESAH